jgi:hypothetical protein
MFVLFAPTSSIDIHDPTTYNGTFECIILTEIQTTLCFATSSTSGPRAAIEEEGAGWVHDIGPGYRSDLSSTWTIPCVALMATLNH